MGLNFTKMHACGNDFIIVDDREQAWRGLESALARRLCARHVALGADGLLLLRRSKAANRFGMVFVNADGLIGEMCGNGARCLAAYLRRAGLAGPALTLETPAGLVEAVFRDAYITLTLPDAGTVTTDLALEWCGQTWRFDALDVGAPHAVCFVADRAALAAIELDALGRHARHHPVFAPRGANINFVADDGERLYLRTYERGVEAETLGCGTGAVAAAVVAHRRTGRPFPVQVQTSSGEVLSVSRAPDGPSLCLQGSAHFVASGKIDDSLIADLRTGTP